MTINNTVSPNNNNNNNNNQKNKNDLKPPFGDENDNAALTAFWICGIRAKESQKGPTKSKIFDPYAEHLMCQWAWNQQDKTKKSIFRLHVAIVNRTLFYDKAIMDAVTKYQCRQMILIGAGLDTRAYRLFQNFPDMHVFEVDHPNMFQYKDQRLKDGNFVPACKRSRIALDYDQVTEWDIRAKQEFGFDPSKPTIFVLEGVTMYIPPEEELDLYRKIDQNAAVNSVIMGCNLKLLRTGGKPRDMGNGITWYDSDRLGMRNILKDWGVTFTRLHWFDFPGIYMMALGMKRPPGKYDAKYKTNLRNMLGVVVGISAILLSLYFYESK